MCCLAFVFWNLLANVAFATPAVPKMGFLDFQKILIDKKIQSVERALPELVAAYPKFFRFRTMLYNSLSLQESSFTEPRVIVFGAEAKFILAFNGNQNMRGGMGFETVEYSPSSQSFLFRAVVFKYPGFDRAKIHLEPGEIALENDQLLISTPNPKVCQACHGTVTRPIWGTYFFWPGAYGSDDDHLHMSFDRASWNPNNEVFFNASTKPQSQGRMMILRNGNADAELDGVIQYFSGRPSHPRYKWLPKEFIEDGVVKHQAGEKFSNLDYSSEATREQMDTQAGYGWPSRPNMFFQNALAVLNDERFFAQVQRLGLKDAFKSPEWNRIEKFKENLDPASPTLVPDLAIRIHQALLTFTFKGIRPSVEEIEAMLKENLKQEMKAQLNKVEIHQRSFAPNSLAYFPYPNNSDNDSRVGMYWLQSPETFYTALLGLSPLTEAAKIAARLETDDPAKVTMLFILLLDRSVDLRDFVMSVRPYMLSLYGFDAPNSLDYLGIRDVF